MSPQELLKKVRRIQIRSKHAVSDLFAGHYQSVFKGQGMEFHEVREYIPGDDLRAIDWNVTARMGTPFIKKYVEEREMTVMLLVDISASHDFGSTSQLKKDLAAELAAVIAFSAIQNNDRVGLILFSDRVEHHIPPRKGVAHVLRVVRDVLSRQPEGRRTQIRPALDFLNRTTSRRSVTFLISDFFFDEPFEKPLAITARRHDLVAVLVGDKREQAWPRAGLIEWEDAETGRRFLVDTSDAATRRRLFDWRGEERDRLLSTLRRANIDAIEVFAGEPYDRELIRFFRQREQRLKG